MLKNQLFVYICNVSQGKRYLISFFALAILLLIFSFLNNRLDKKIGSFEFEIKNLQEKKSQLSTLEQEKKISRFKGQINKGLTKKDVTNDRLFLNLARNANLKISSYLPEEVNNQNYCKTKYKLSLHGNFDDAYSFFNELVEVKTTIKCCKLKLTNQNGIINIETTYNCYLTNEKSN